MWGGAVSVIDGRLMYCRSGLLEALILSGPSWFFTFSIGSFLVLLLGVMPCILLTQLLFQIVVLLSEALHNCDESLNLSLEGSWAWFVYLNVISGGRH